MNVLEPSTGFEEIYEKWTRTKLELRTVTQRLQQVHEWLPVLTTLRSKEEARTTFDRLSAQRVQLLKKLHQLRQDSLKEFIPPRPGPPEGDLPNFEPTREQLERAVITKRILDKYSLESAIRRPELPEDEPAPSPWTAIIHSYHVTEYPGIQWSDDPDATFSKTLIFDPYTDIRRGIVAGRFRINNPAPFNWPIIQEEHDWAQMMVCAALCFNIPAPSYDSMVFYETGLVLGLSPDYSVRDYLFDGSCLLFEQRNAATGAPQSLSDFERIGDGIMNKPGVPLKQTDGVNLSRNFFAPAGTPSKIYLGFFWNLSISSGDGGTNPSCWDNFIVFAPTGSDIWGLKVTQVPV